MNEVQNELKHYGVLGMKWGVRRAEKRFEKAKRKGQTAKAAKLKQTLGEQKRIANLRARDKIFLSREGVLANMRMMKKGEPAVERLIKLHAVSLGVGAGVQSVGGSAQRSVSANMAKKIADGKNVAGDVMGLYGMKIATDIVQLKVTDEIYKKMGR